MLAFLRFWTDQLIIIILNFEKILYKSKIYPSK